MLQGNNPKLIIYAGAAPGNHILDIIKKFHNSSITWILYDTAKFHNNIEQNKSKYNIIIENKFIDDNVINEYILPTSVYRNHDKHIISDIRFTINDEPTTEDLLRDYSIENNLVMKLNPKTAFLKWRYPYIEKNSNLTFKRVFGSITEEWIQPFAKQDSSELRLYITGEYYLKDINTSDILTADNRMALYKYIDRYIPRIIKSEYMLISSCKCNDCSLLNILAYQCKKLNIYLTVDDIIKASVS
jgi:hypothetical protein